MRKHLAFSATLFLATCAAAQTPPLPQIPTPTRDWGCEVLLCLANPAGPTAAAACVPPIHRLWRHLARGRAFPSCTMASGPNGRSYARLGYSHYDPCPVGTSALEPGQVAQLASPMATNAVPALPSGLSSYAAGTAGVTYSGIGSADGAGYLDYDSAGAPKVCVAGYRGVREVGEGENRYGIHVYDQVYVAAPQASPRLIDVYIDNALWHRVRW